jgi:hypothetical protein
VVLVVVPPEVLKRRPLILLTGPVDARGAAREEFRIVGHSLSDPDQPLS